MTQQATQTELRQALQQSAFVIQKLQKKLASYHEPIAVIGMACRFPGADSPEAFWTLLQQGQDLVTTVPADRWDADAYYNPVPGTAGKTYVRAAAFLEQVDQFDAQFFGVSPREAVVLDPQQRLLLEVCWEALERAGQAPAALANSQTGVYLGVSPSDYHTLMDEATSYDVYSSTGNGPIFASGRLSYVLGLQGPNLVIDTACSASLIGVHLACESLRNGSSDLALAGGVHLLLSPQGHIGLAQMQALAPDGRCKTFDTAANGFGRGEGCGMVVLKRLSDAQAAGDNILAVIRGSAINHDGVSSGLTVPSATSQATLIRQALANGRVTPEEVSYIEAHGTGTTLGDPIEVRAISAVFGKRSTPLLLGSVKTNFGHLEEAAGIAGLMKVILAMQQGEIPPHLHFHHPNPHIDWERSALAVPTTGTAWPAVKKLAGVSAFGMGGSNAHVVVEEAPPPISSQSGAGNERPWHLLTLSAKNAQALHALAQRYWNVLQAQPTLALGDLCNTAHTGRNHFAHRLSIVASSATQLASDLAAYAAGKPAAGTQQGTFSESQAPRKIAFLFTGQGAQYVEMGWELYETQPHFRTTLDRCDALFQQATGESLLAVLYPERETGRQGDKETVAPKIKNQKSKIDETAYTQPALFALEVALATLWQAWGIQPDVLIGHSIGELAAACVAGVFSLEDGLKLVAARGRLMGALPQEGAMVSLLASEVRVRQAIAPYVNEVSLAAINGSESIVIAGKRAAVLTIAERFAAEGVKTRPLTVSHAFHSPLMEPMLADFRQVAQTITYHKPKLALVSNVTGKLAGDEITTSDYWVRHVREAVRFADGVAALHEQGATIFLEIGPKPTLVGMAGEVKTDRQPPMAVSYLPSLRDGKSDWQQILESLGALYVHGVAIDWQGFDKEYPRRKVALPTYPFQRQRYWLEAKASNASTGVAQDGFGHWLAENKLEELTDWVTTKGRFVGDERATIERVLATLRATSHAQQLAAQVKAMLYDVAWERQRLTPMPPTTPGRWLLVADEQGISKALVTQLTALGETVEVLSLQADLTTSVTQRLTVDMVQSWRGVVYLRGIATTRPGDSTDLMWHQEHVLGNLLSLVQTLASQAKKGPRLWVVTQGAQPLTASEPVAVTQAPLWGLGRVIGLEHSELWGGLVDLDPTVDPAAAATSLVAELLQQQATGETQVAYRQGVRHVARLVQGQVTPHEQAPVIHAHATYLVTGGLGALGIIVAQWLAEQGAKQLILTGRRGITHEAQQTAVAALMDKGVAVEVAHLDVADEAAMRQFFADLASRTTPLKGIFHTAGVIDDGILINQSWARFATVLAAKVAGSWLLHELTCGLDLDYLVFFSSVSSLLGNRGQGNYAAANAFMDGLAHYRRQQGLPALSINWGAWADAGMATRTTQVKLASNELITAETGMAALAQLLVHSATGRAQISVAPIDWSHFSTLGHPAPFLRNFVAITEPAAVQATLVTALAALPANRRLEQLRSYLQGSVGRVLGMADLPEFTTGFTDLGMDSLMALELRRRLEQELDLALPTTLAFEYPTVDALAAYLLTDVLQLGEPTPRTKNSAPQRQSAGLDEPIAVVSLACRFPGADTPEAFWQLLCDGVDMVQPIPTSRWPIAAYYDPQRPMPGKMYMREAAFVEHADQFDPLFFGIAPREATGMDPMHRLLLEVSWEALERAGLAQQDLVDSPTGVFVGIGQGEYGVLGGSQELADFDTHAATSGGHSVAAGRLAYTLGLQGPTLAVDTACSSSLVALHLACQSLRTGECNLALAGGVSLMLSPAGHVMLSQMQALSPDGRCKTFAAAADGYGRGEGGGMVVLKRLSDAEADGNPILAVIRGSAVNHDGPSSGLTVPNKRAQEKLLRQALANAQVAPDEVSYVEAHGTGTPLGDPIEIRALGAVFGANRTHPLLVGSVKTNVGHLEAAAGIAGFVKTVLALHHGQIPPHLHFTTPNPYIEWDEFALTVPTSLQPWPASDAGKVQVAGISAFGISGTNAHLIVAAAPQGERATRGQEDKERESRAQLLPISAKSAAALRAYAGRYWAWLTAHPELPFADLCYSAAVGRNHFNWRVGLVAQDRAALLTQLAAVMQGEETAGVAQGNVSPQPPRIAFLFTGQGSQYVGMGRELYATNPTFRATLDRCDALLQECLGRSLLELLYPTTPPAHNDLLESHPCGQAANFALECALADLWRSWGIQPAAVLGHSLGDFAAAYTAGVLSLEDGLRLVTERGRLMEQAHGSMVSVLASEAEVLPFITGYTDVTIGVINGPKSVVLSGGHASIAQVVEQLQAVGFKTRKLDIPVAAHSPMLDPVLAAFEATVRKITLSKPQLPVVSSMTGKFVSEELTDPTYWRKHLRNTVRFADGVQTLQAQGCTIFLEIGPKPTLVGMAEAIYDVGAQRGPELNETSSPDKTRVKHKAQIENPVMLPSLREHQNDWQQMLASLGELYVHGVAINWPGLDKEYHQCKVALPTYPFQRERYWVAETKQRRKATLRPLIDKMTYLPLHQETVFEAEFSVEFLPFLGDHRVYGEVVSPGACQLAMVLNAADAVFGEVQPLALEDIILPQALVLPADGARTVQVILPPVDADRRGPQQTFKLISFDATSPLAAEQVVTPATHATGYIKALTAAPPPLVDLQALRQRCNEAVDLTAAYAMAATAEIELGPAFRWLVAAWQGTTDATSEETNLEVLGKLALPDAIGSIAGYRFHPGLLDGCFQVTGMAGRLGERQETMLPFALRALLLYQPIQGDSWWCYARRVGNRKWTMQLLNEKGEVIVCIEEYEARTAPLEAVRGQAVWRDWLYEVAWQPRPYFGLQPDYLPSPATVALALRAIAPQLWADHGGDAYQTLLTGLEALSIDYVVAALTKTGLSLQPGLQLRPEQLSRRLGVISIYRRLLVRLLAMLAEAGILEANSEGWRVVSPPETVDPTARLQALQHTYGESPELILLARCGERLGEVLRGLQEPLDLLFPGGDTTVTGQLYRATPGAQVMNRLLQDAVQALVAQLPTGQGVRIVEIGAGTGGTTAGVLPLLPADRTDYLFTDIGLAFLSKAREQFADYAFMRYQPLDIEQAPDEQGVGAHQADLVIAANVLHATRDLAETLAHVRQLLQPGGQLLLLEGTQRSRFVDLTFGLTDGWWRFADRRQEHPLLTAEQWRVLLLEWGFHPVEIIEQNGQALILAQMVAELAEATVSPTTTERAQWVPAFGHKAVAELAEAWLIFADNQGVGEALAVQLRQRGEQPILIRANQAYTQVDHTTIQLHPDCGEDYQRLLREVSKVKGIVHLWSLDAPRLHDGIDLVSAAQQICGTALHLVQALLQAQLAPAGLWLVTRDAQAAILTDSVQGVAQAGLWGMGKVIALEHPELNCIRIDLDGARSAADHAAYLCAELTVNPAASMEEQVALRQDGRYVARLTRHQPAQALTVPTGPYRLESSERGTLDNLQLRPVARQAPAPDEVEIKVQAAGMNFRDVLNALGLYPGDPGPLGGECAGVVVAVGADVTQFTEGDAVLALASGAFSRYVTTKASLVIHRPATLSAVDAATIPVVFLTAYYGLHELAQMKASSRVLIHAATGGVGMAAVQLAHRVGAKVYATASPGKWATLRRMGVTHIYNSRTTDFCDQVLADTDDHGVDIILNSLTGPGFIEASLAALAPNGYLVEMSKRDIWSAEQVAAVRPDVRYTYFDLGEVMSGQPQLLKTMFQTLMAALVEGKLKPLPHRVFPLSDAVRAFRYMQQAKHVGKLVLTPPVAPGEAIPPDATYLVTGGLGGLGLAVAQWLAEQGARHLLLLGRSAPKPEVQSQLDALAKMGVRVTVAQVDVTDLAQLQAVLQQIDALYPLRGVIHSVGVLDDGALVQQTWTRFAKVLAPKLQGAWHLHELTKELALDFFVLFSSAAGLLGNRGQANHAAANAFLDAFVHYRRAQGLPALSINWGAWSEIGAAANLVREQGRQLTAQGMGFITPQQGIQAFAYLLQQPQPQVGVVPIRWHQYLDEAKALPAFYAEFQQRVIEQTLATAPQAISVRQELAETEPEQRRNRLLHHLRIAAAKVLGLRHPEQIDPRHGLMDMGLDSLMAIELRNTLSKSLALHLPSTLLFDYPTLDDVTTYVLTQLSEQTDAVELSQVQRQAPSAENLETRIAHIAQISDDEAEALLMAKLGDL